MVATPAAGKIVRWFREPLIKSSMSRVLIKIAQIQGDATQVVSSIRGQGTQQRRWAVKTRMGAGFPGGLLCCKAGEGEQPFAAPRALHPFPENQRAAMWDLIRASLALPLLYETRKIKVVKIE